MIKNAPYWKSMYDEELNNRRYLQEENIRLKLENTMLMKRSEAITYLETSLAKMGEASAQIIVSSVQIINKLGDKI
jgi:hypothetical protein